MPDFLKDKLRPASFRGVPFQVEGTGMDTGRRVQVHEYPQRDKPYVQDLGRATRNLKFKAFVVGVDYIAKANALLGALEAYGAGALIHPWLGSLKVSVTGCSVEFGKGLGFAEFDLEFVESGELAFPANTPSTAALARTAASGLEQASVFSFANIFKTLGFVGNVADQAFIVYGNVLKFLGNPAFVLGNLTGYGSLLGNLSSLKALFGTPLDLGWNFAGSLNLSGSAKNIATSDTVTAPFVRGLVKMAVDPALAQPVTGIYAVNNSPRIANNKKAILANTRQLLLSSACGMSSYVACSIYDDTLALKNELTAALDAETLLTDDDDLYQTLMSARTAIWDDLTERSRNSARLTTYAPNEVMPMLAIAYDFYEDASRDGEIVLRNKIPNPGFVPAKPLLVLSR